MRDFKFFQNKSFFTRMAEELQTNEVQRQVYVPLRITQVEQMERERTINDALRHEEYLHSTYLRNESVVDYGQMARDIREQAQLRAMATRSIERPAELLHRGRRPRNPY